MADPQALVVVSAAARAFEWVGMPEGYYFLSHACIYLTTAPKSNSAGAIWKALAHIEQHGAGPVPPYLRDKTDTFQGPARQNYQRAMEEAVGDRGAYQYPHDFPGGWVDQHYLPLEMDPPGWYRPKDIGYEQVIRERWGNLGHEGESG